MTLRLHTFGAVYLARDRRTLERVHTQRRRLALLAYLSASEPPVVTRHKVIALLWPESDEARGHHSLSQLLYALRHDLDAGAIKADHETVGIDPAVLESDVRDFDSAVRSGELERAVELYRGPFLDGFHVDDAPEMERWIDSARAHRASQCALVLDRLATDAESRADWHRAHEWWRRRAILDPSDARTTLHLMRALVAVGDRRGALQASSVYETTVREELEAEPDAGVAKFATELRNGAHQIVEVPILPAQRVETAVPQPSTVPTAYVSARDTPETPQTVEREHVAEAPRQTRRWIAVAAGIAAMVAGLVWRQLDRADSSPTPTHSAIVVIGDLGGPDSVLALAVREALRAELSNTPGVVVMSDQGVRELEILMRLPDAALRPPALIAIATRGGAHVAISGSVVPVGSGAQIVVDVIDPHTSRVTRTFAERPLDAQGILKSAGRLAREVGGMVSRAPRDTSIRALPAVTTASLTALKSYALARQSASRGLRLDALEHGERAVTHDTTFVLAHYLLGDLLWFLDEQSHSDAHLTRAWELSGTVPRREQLMIRARHEQLVRDQPDSALVYWDLLLDAFPGDVLAYEGRTWALRALGRHEEAAASAVTAMTLDPAAVAPNTNNAMYSLLAVGDTAGALAVAERVRARNPEAVTEARFHAALQRRDFDAAIALADRSIFASPRSWRRQLVHLAQGEVDAARGDLDSLKLLNHAQFVPRALLNQGWAELALNRRRNDARPYARAALAWLARRDLSPPAVARLAERTADLAARAGDEETVLAVTALVRQRDRGRGMRSYVMAQRTLDAALAYVRGDFAGAATRAEQARHGVYFWRSLLSIVKLEADARRASGQAAAADSLDRLITTHQIVDGDFETWSVLRGAAMLSIADK